MIEMVPQINVVRLDFLLVQLLCGEDKGRDALCRTAIARARCRAGKWLGKYSHADFLNKNLE